ncbi:MAG: metalloregulator ArsR/SmtB family transcription factor [Acidobacteria bacterium]|nr:metalloregulator ArsR/SmtB family transcription factor [Acidobacteriota bacterium]
MNPAEVFKVLSVDSRIRILEILKTQGPMGTNKIALILGITPAAVSQHLKVMRQAGIIYSERDGYWIPHAIDEEAMQVCQQLLTHICSCNSNGRHNVSGTVKIRENNPVDVLKQYKKRLEAELKDVEKKIKELEE